MCGIAASINNYIELKEQLNHKSAHFIMETDTEAILEAYRFGYKLYEVFQ